ncbi:hypothetical protein B0H12DRAFT_1152541 [Mycena haematopus]|nr:hypothetical protein B0H12DRAFT_1152541 [Mycena haematopus]
MKNSCCPGVFQSTILAFLARAFRSNFQAYFGQLVGRFSEREVWGFHAVGRMVSCGCKIHTQLDIFQFPNTDT